MAEAIAIEVVKVILEKLTDEALKKYARSQGIHTELKNLGKHLTKIQALLADASQKEVNDEAVKQWLHGLQHLAYDIDDVLDDVATEALHPELAQQSGASTSKVRKLIPTCCLNFSLTHRLQSRLDRITTDLESLYKEKSDLGLIVKDEKPKNTGTRIETSLLDASRVVGREAEMKKLLNKLLTDDTSKEESDLGLNDKNFSVVPIVGMGGLGKTTLARLLYNDKLVEDHFELRAWVCVSDDFDIVKISEIIFQDVSKETNKFPDLNQLQKALRENLKDKLFLLVLDDVWHEKYDDWEKLVRPFHSCAPGSRIIMTTRKEQLLKELGFEHLDRLGNLLPQDALCLFAQHALGVDNFDLHKTFEPQGKGIVKKCGGLPLALKVVGRLMKTKTTEEDWEDVLTSEIWNLQNAGEILPALRLSYHELSSDLQQLFAYCSLFPKDTLLDKEELVLLWMAEGFLNHSNTTSPERLGLQYFEILLSRSFIQHAPNDESLFVMHDLLNDLATFVVGDFILRFDNHIKLEKEALTMHRHMSFVRERFVGYKKLEAFKGAKCLRTLLAVSLGQDQYPGYFYFSNKILVDLLPELPLLRVLSLSRVEISEVPDVIGSLKHLRYLNLARTNIKELPENVGSLYNLETLIVSRCRRLTKLPISFSKLKKLRHFDMRDTPLLKKLPMGIAELESIQTLTKIIIGGEDGFTMTELKRLKNLYGKISIEGLHEVKSAIDAREANLSLKRITDLELKWGPEFDGSRRGTLEKEVLNELKPNSNKLKRCVVECYGATEFSSWVGDPSFMQLAHVSLRGCKKCTLLPPLGQLPSLKELFIQGMDEIKVVGSELLGNTGVAFRSLEVLEFQDMLGWEVWSGNKDVVFPFLRELRLLGCANLIDCSLTTLPCLRFLKLNTCTECVLRNLVQAASSTAELDIESISGLTDEVWRGLTKYLGKVEKVRMWDCKEIRYMWESEAQASQIFLNLKELDVRRCSELVSLGEREREEDNSLLLSLRKLMVYFCDKLEHCRCPDGVEELVIYHCSSVTRVSFPTSATGYEGGQKLKRLSIHGCQKITRTTNTRMTMLEDLCIQGWTSLKSIIQLDNFVHLTDLTIEECPSIESFPDLKNRTLLKRLAIVACPSMDYSFPCGIWPPNMVKLRIGGLKKPILEWGNQSFPTSLVTLWLVEEHVGDFSQLSNLLPSSLTRFYVQRFDKLESLRVGLQHLTSLQYLFIFDCPKMIHLPESLLPSLLQLVIYSSPILAEMCNGRDSHYWRLISHIPNIEIEIKGTC